MTARRQFLLFLGAEAIAALHPSFAREHRVKGIGFLSGGTVQANRGWLTAFRKGMAEMGWSEARDYVIDARYANGDPKALASLAPDLVAHQPDVVLTPRDEPAQVLVKTTHTIPIVLAIATDPVGNGFAASLQRPGGNVTGVTNLASELGAKRLQLLKEASRLRLRVTAIGLRRAADIEEAFKRGAMLRAHACMMISIPLMNVNLKTAKAMGITFPNSILLRADRVVE